MEYMQKIVVIGDIHGRDTWWQIAEANLDADKIVFIGDYLDPVLGQYIEPEDQLANLNEIIRFRRDNPDRVIMLFGNHDEHYRLFNVNEDYAYSRFQVDMVPEFTPLIEELIENRDVQVAWFHGKYIFSHAGITNTWMQDWGVTEYNINDKLIEQPEAFRFISRGYGYSGSGDNIFQGPLWVRMASLRKDAYKKYTHIHVVGHTQVDNIQPDAPICGIDALKVGQYLVIENGEMVVRKVG